MGFGGTRSALGALTFVACVAGVSAEAHAQRHPPAKGTKEAVHPNRTRASELFKKSADAYLRGDFAQAITHLDEAYALDPQPVLIYNKARANEGLGHVEEAIDLYEKYRARPTVGRSSSASRRFVTSATNGRRWNGNAPPSSPSAPRSRRRGPRFPRPRQSLLVVEASCPTS